ncbi:hypothetical protein BK133_29765 [Paenibacillus sp. FSL H8-0548]|uniref:hypothetical protein n=1 Tax=Paenibacillus sp. FSL H8-0548 TaxID=1920422 RepID=UPI00096F0EDA|nr:hypothetical protein [Paenibacillus sp. FSL H8-0548]OMF19720.1 hypothetical protein BK133_29765 [Paenibacillus sp. FSL H8-0548]
MINVKEAENQLKAMIRNINADDILNIWNTFKTFAKVEVECAESSLLFQCGVYNFTGTELFYFDFVRQFTIEEEGEYSHMEQLHCEYTFPPVDELRSLKKSLWSYDTDDNLALFFTTVESLKEFLIPISRNFLLELKVYQEEI